MGDNEDMSNSPFSPAVETIVTGPTYSKSEISDDEAVVDLGKWEKEVYDDDYSLDREFEPENDAEFQDSPSFGQSEDLPEKEASTTTTNSEDFAMSTDPPLSTASSTANEDSTIEISKTDLPPEIAD